MNYKRYMIIMSCIILIFNAIAWCSPVICDWYTHYIFPVWVNLIGRMMNLFSFSVGEMMIVLAVILVFVALLLGICCIFLRKKTCYMRRVVKFYKVFWGIVVNVCLLMTLNCSFLYHCNRLDPNKEKENRAYTISELETLRNHIVEQCNSYAELMERDEEGDVIYQGDMQAEAKKALRTLSEEYPYLSGYYPDVKYMKFSDIMSQSYIAGYYFPFSLEANCNRNMYITNYPATFCHELAHLRGFIYEDEAEFISFLACTGSEDEFFRYGGYIEVLNYVNNAYIESLDWSKSGTGEERYRSQAEISELVEYDNMFLKEETWEEVEEDALISTDTMEEISDTFTDISIKANGVEEGIAAYSGVVELLLQYYDGILY